MRLKWINGSFFRGFGKATPIDLDSDLIIVFGPNGSGKTSIAEAFEWLFFGTTRRRIRSEVDEVEYRQCFKNVKCPDDSDPSVEAEVQLDDGSLHTIRRVMHFDGTREYDTVYIDEVKFPDFSSISLHDSDHFYPIIVQHNLQELIFSTGAQRRKVISRLLGLEPLLTYDKALDSAIDRFENSVPLDIRTSLSEFTEHQLAIGKIEELRDISTEWSGNNVKYPDDWEKIFKYLTTRLSLAEADVGEVKLRLNELISDARKKIFDVESYAVSDNLEINLNFLHSQREILVEDFGALKTAASDYLGAKKDVYERLKIAIDATRLDFYRKGLSQIETNVRPIEQPINCPFCDEPTITEAKVQTLEEKLRVTDYYSTQRNSLATGLSKLLNDISALTTSARQFSIREVDDEAYAELSKLLPQHMMSINNLRDNAKEINILIDKILGALNATREKLNMFTDWIDTPNKYQEIENLFATIMPQIFPLIESLMASNVSYKTQHENIAQLLEPVLSTYEAVRNWEKLKKLSESQKSIMVKSSVLSTLEDLRNARQELREYLKKEDIKRIKDRGLDIKEWFAMLYGGATTGVNFHGVDPSGTVMRIMAEIFGEKRHASTHMSQSQLNCLGLAMNIVATTWKNSPFNFIVFDDPIQALDDDHIESFKEKVIKGLIENKNRQLIVMTHLKNVADDLRHLYRSKGPKYYHINQYGNNGLSLKEYFHILEDLNRLKYLASSVNDNNRIECRVELRIVCEKIVKELYRVERKSEVPPKYRKPNVTWNSLKPLCKQTTMTENEFNSLDRTVGFSDPGHHDDTTAQPPSESQLQPHVDKLFSFAKHKGIIN